MWYKSDIMKVLIVLFVAFLLSLCIYKWASGSWNFLMAGNIALSVMMCFAASGHFAFTKGMEMMLPDFVPFKKAVVMGTGILEIAAGIGLLFSQTRAYASVFLIAFFVLILPANIYATIHHIDLQKGDFNGPGTSYLWFRIPMQVLLIAWAWYFGLKLTA